MFDEVIHTDNFMLRRVTREDAGSVYPNWATDPEVTKYLIWKPHKSIDETYEWITMCDHGWNSKESFSWVICLHNSNEPIGSFAARIKGHMVDVGYGLSKRYWGQGIMTSILKNFINYAFSFPSVYRIWATCNIENTASMRVTEKAGMLCEGCLKSWLIHPNISQKPCDCWCYSIVKDV